MCYQGWQAQLPVKQIDHQQKIKNQKTKPMYHKQFRLNVCLVSIDITKTTLRQLHSIILSVLTCQCRVCVNSGQRCVSCLTHVNGQHLHNTKFMFGIKVDPSKHGDST
jgi:hypothetical protein